jgi:hypothetical protein
MCKLNPLYPVIRELFGGIMTYVRQKTMTEQFFQKKSILHYLTHLHKNNVTIACVNQVKPALSLMIEMYGGDTSVFTQRVDHWISAV